MPASFYMTSQRPYPRATTGTPTDSQAKQPPNINGPQWGMLVDTSKGLTYIHEDFLTCLVYRGQLAVGSLGRGSPPGVSDKDNTRLYKVAFAVFKCQVPIHLRNTASRRGGSSSCCQMEREIPADRVSWFPWSWWWAWTSR